MKLLLLSSICFYQGWRGEGEEGEVEREGGGVEGWRGKVKGVEGKEDGGGRWRGWRVKVEGKVEGVEGVEDGGGGDEDMPL